MSEQDKLEQYNEHQAEQFHYYEQQERPPCPVQSIMLEDETMVTANKEIGKELHFIWEPDGSSWVTVTVMGKEVVRYNARYLSSIVWS